MILLGVCIQSLTQKTRYSYQSPLARDDKNAGGVPNKTSQPNLTKGRHVNCEIRSRMKPKEYKIGYKCILLFWHPHTSPGIEAETSEITKNHL